MLEVSGVSVSYGAHRAVDSATLRVAPGEIVVVLGANGAGKSSLLKGLAGLVAKAPGAHVTLGGRSIADLPAHRVVEAGLALVPEGRGIFGELTVRENLRLGANPRRARAGEAERLADVLASFPRLAERLSQTARTMSGGEQQMVALGRALMSAPDVLLLDEPSLGLSPLMSREVFATIRGVSDRGLGILMVEQNARRSLSIADRAYAMANGRIVVEGSAAAMRDDPQVRSAYLGGEPAPS